MARMILAITVGLMHLVICPPAVADKAAETTLAPHEGYRGIWVRSEAIEAFVALEPQFRVLSIKRPDEGTLMAGQAVAEHGLRLAFMEPDQVPASFDVGNVPAELLERSEGSVRVRLAAAEGLQYSVWLRLDQAHPRIELRYTLSNVGDGERRVAPWSVLSYARDGVMVVPFGDQPRARRRIVLPWWGEWPQPGIRISRTALLSDASAPLAGGAYKVGVITEAGWVAFARDGQGLVSQVRFEPDQVYPEDGANITLFHAAGEARTWCETEQVGSLRRLVPGASATMVETIELIRFDPPVDPTPDTMRSVIETARQK